MARACSLSSKACTGRCGAEVNAGADWPAGAAEGVRLRLPRRGRPKASASCRPWCTASTCSSWSKGQASTSTAIRERITRNGRLPARRRRRQPGQGARSRARIPACPSRTRSAGLCHRCRRREHGRHVRSLTCRRLRPGPPAFRSSEAIPGKDCCSRFQPQGATQQTSKGRHRRRGAGRGAGPGFQEPGRTLHCLGRPDDESQHAGPARGDPRRCPTSEVIILPNNGNILMAASRHRPWQSSDKMSRSCHQRPSRKGSARSWRSTRTPTWSNVHAMTTALGNVQTGEVTMAVQDARFDGIEVTRRRDRSAQRRVDGHRPDQSGSREKVAGTDGCGKPRDHHPVLRSAGHRQEADALLDELRGLSRTRKSKSSTATNRFITTSFQPNEADPGCRLWNADLRFHSAM